MIYQSLPNVTWVETDSLYTYCEPEFVGVTNGFEMNHTWYAYRTAHLKASFKCYVCHYNDVCHITCWPVGRQFNASWDCGQDECDVEESGLYNLTARLKVTYYVTSYDENCTPSSAYEIREWNYATHIRVNIVKQKPRVVFFPWFGWGMPLSLYVVWGWDIPIKTAILNGRTYDIHNDSCHWPYHDDPSPPSLLGKDWHFTFGLMDGFQSPSHLVLEDILGNTFNYTRKWSK